MAAYARTRSLRLAPLRGIPPLLPIALAYLIPFLSCFRYRAALLYKRHDSAPFAASGSPPLCTALPTAHTGCGKRGRRRKKAEGRGRRTADHQSEGRGLPLRHWRRPPTTPPAPTPPVPVFTPRPPYTTSSPGEYVRSRHTTEQASATSPFVPCPPFLPYYAAILKLPSFLRHACKHNMLPAFKLPACLPTIPARMYLPCGNTLKR